MEDSIQLSNLPELGFDTSPLSLDDVSLGFQDFRDEPGVTYPALLLSNVHFLDALKVLKQAKRDSYRSVSVWAELPNGEGFSDMGTIQLDSTVLLLLRHLHIGAVVYYSREEIEALDLNDPAVLERFI